VNDLKAESRRQKAERRRQKAERRKQKAEKQKTKQVAAKGGTPGGCMPGVFAKRTRSLRKILH
jgi:hypothetical protein